MLIVLLLKFLVFYVECTLKEEQPLRVLLNLFFYRFNHSEPTCKSHMTTLAGGCLITNYQDAGHKVSKVTWTEAENKRDQYVKQRLTVGIGDH